MKPGDKAIYHDMDVEIERINSDGTVDLKVFGTVWYELYHVMREDIEIK